MIEIAILKLRPTSRFRIANDDLSTLVWDDESTTPPSVDEINAEVARLQSEYQANQYQRDRAAEYPDFKDYLDGIVKGDTAQVQAYIDACNAVKAKYPKG
jgi:hypothetical protein